MEPPPTYVDHARLSTETFGGAPRSGMAPVDIDATVCWRCKAPIVGGFCSRKADGCPGRLGEGRAWQPTGDERVDPTATIPVPTSADALAALREDVAALCDTAGWKSPVNLRAGASAREIMNLLMGRAAQSQAEQDALDGLQRLAAAEPPQCAAVCPPGLAAADRRCVQITGHTTPHMAYRSGVGAGWLTPDTPVASTAVPATTSTPAPLSLRVPTAGLSTEEAMAVLRAAVMRLLASGPRHPTLVVSAEPGEPFVRHKVDPASVPTGGWGVPMCSVCGEPANPTRSCPGQKPTHNES